MSFTEQEESRIRAIEKRLNDLQIAVNKLATKSELNALLSIRQKEIIDLRSLVEQLLALLPSP